MTYYKGEIAVERTAETVSWTNLIVANTTGLRGKSISQYDRQYFQRTIRVHGVGRAMGPEPVPLPQTCRYVRGESFAFFKNL